MRETSRRSGQADQHGSVKRLQTYSSAPFLQSDGFRVLFRRLSGSHSLVSLVLEIVVFLGGFAAFSFAASLEKSGKVGKKRKKRSQGLLPTVSSHGCYYCSCYQGTIPSRLLNYFLEQRSPVAERKSVVHGGRKFPIVVPRCCLTHTHSIHPPSGKIGNPLVPGDIRLVLSLMPSKVKSNHFHLVQ